MTLESQVQVSLDLVTEFPPAELTGIPALRAAAQTGVTLAG